MDEKEIFLTAEGLKKLELELEELKTVKRKEIAEKIKIARDFGDLSENSEYDEAKNEQTQIEEKMQLPNCVLYAFSLAKPYFAFCMLVSYCLLHLS